MPQRWQKTAFFFMLLCLIGGILFPVVPALASGKVMLFTEYPGIAVTPGESINYSIRLINSSNSIQHVALQIAEQPEGWETNLTAGGWSINQLSVRPQSEESFNLQTEVPLQVEKGSYHFVLRASGSGSTSTLPITIDVTQQGTFKTELESDQPNMQGNADSAFNYDLTLKNRTADEQLYALSAAAPRGWNVDFLVSGQKVTSVKVEANTAQKISVTIAPPSEIEAGNYLIPVKAQAGSFSAETELEVNITGTYRMELGTPTGRLSTELNAGREKMIELQINNTGSSELEKIKLSNTAPVDWEVRFEPGTIDSLLPAESATVNVYIKSSGKAISGDYVVGIKAQTAEVADNADFRVTVKTSALWGWVGILLIALVAAGIYYLFRKFGRQ